MVNAEFSSFQLGHYLKLVLGLDFLRQQLLMDIARVVAQTILQGIID